MNPFHNRPDEWELYQPLHGETMLELGGKINAGLTYKAFFESKGFRHVSVDWNGEHGALNLDLRRELSLADLGAEQPFDMVCNIGTTEHVSEQYGVWENIHRLTAVGGVLVSVTPYHDGASWWWHGEHYPTEQFFESFAYHNGWEIERMYCARYPPHENLYVRAVKQDERIFKMPNTSLIKKNIRRSR